jgi:hypothetical protein
VQADLARLELGEVETISDSSVAERRMKPICFSCSGLRGPSARARSRRARPMIEFTGVRNSWLTFETTRDFTSEVRRSESAFSSSSV